MKTSLFYKTMALTALITVTGALPQPVRGQAARPVATPVAAKALVITPGRQALPERIKNLDRAPAQPDHSRQTGRTSGDKVRRGEFRDVDLTAQAQGVGQPTRPLHHLSPELMEKVSGLTDPHFMRRAGGGNGARVATAHRSTDKDLPWTADQKLANPTDMNDEYVSLAEYPATGNLYAVFAAKDLGGTDRDIHIARSLDAGQTWTVWEMPSFNDDEYQPEIAIDGGGYLHVVWIRADGYILRARTTNPDDPTQWAWVKGLAVGEPCATPSIAVSGAGDFAKVFIAAGWLTINYDYYQYEWTMVFMSSANGGNSVDYDYFLPDAYADYWPDVTISGGTVHFVNAEVDAYTGETEILIATDAYNGSFSDPASLTGWTPNNAGFPQIAGQGDDVYVVYQLDWTDGVTSDGDIIYSYSWDAGASWFGPYGMVADEYDSVGPTIFVKDGIVGCLWLDAPAGADEYQLGSRLGSGYGGIDFFGDVQIVTEQPRVEPTFHSANGVVAADLVHAAWIDRRDFATEGHNVYTSRQALQPNLAPFTPADWDTSLIVNMIPGERGDGWIAADDTAFVSFACLNQGLKDTGAAFYIDLQVDGETAASWEFSGGLATGTYLPLEDFPLILPAGEHTIALVIDPTDLIAEADETDNIISRTFTWLNGAPEMRLQPTALITVVTPPTARAAALVLAADPPTRREVHLPVISADLNEAMSAVKSGDMLRVMIVPAERLDAPAMALALQDAGRVTRQEAILAGARTQLARSYASLEPALRNLVVSGQATEPQPLWLPGMIAMDMRPSAIAELAGDPAVGYLWQDQTVSETFGRPAIGAPVAAPDKALAWHLAAIGADQAWADGDYGEGILVGHLDTGLAYDHPDLDSHLWDGGTAFPHHGWDAVDDDNDPYDGDTAWYHGTHTGGLIIGDGSNGTATGVAPGATLMILRAVPGYFADITEAMQFGLDHGVQIFSMSAGWSLAPDDVRVANRYNAELLLSLDIPWVCAAGNGDNYGGHHPVPADIASPGDCPGPWYAPNGGQTSVFTVGAVDIAGQVAPTSSNGPTEWNTDNPNGTNDYHDYPYPSGLMKPDLAAPGVNITSTTGRDGYVSYDGTSMACPLVTGAFALAMSGHPGLTPAQLAEMFETTASDLTVPPATAGRDNLTGAGQIDIPAALAQAPSARPLQVEITNFGNLPLVFGTTYTTAAWLRIDTPGGYLAPGASRRLDVTIDPTLLQEGTYEAAVLFMTNNPGLPRVLPVTLIYGDYVSAVGDDLPDPRGPDLANYPNPFNPRTMVRFRTTAAGPVTLTIHDIRGHLIRSLVNREVPAGKHEVLWDGRDEQGAAVASGQYFARLTASSGPPVSRKLMLVR